MDVIIFLSVSFVSLTVSAALYLFIKITFDKYRLNKASSGMSGVEIAQHILAENKIYDVQIQIVPGQMTDRYNLKQKVLSLSEQVAYGRSVSAIAVAAHECGHVIQHYTGYGLLKFRNAMTPVVKVGFCIGFLSLLLGLTPSWEPLLPVGIVLLSTAVLFYIVTLPVEFNASARAMTILEDKRLIRYDETESTKIVLRAAAMTYITLAIAAISKFLSSLGGGDD